MIALLAVFITVLCVVSHSSEISIDETRSQYQQFLREFGKEHHHLNDTRRVAQFHRFHTLVKEHNAMNNGITKTRPAFTIKLNAMSDLLPEEIEQRFGFRESIHKLAPDKAPKRHKPKRRQLSDQSKRGYRSNYYPFFPWGGDKEPVAEDDSPNSLDWSTHNNPIGSSVMSAVRNQGSCGACWAFVAVATVEAALRIALSTERTNSATHNMLGADVSAQPNSDSHKYAVAAGLGDDVQDIEIQSKLTPDNAAVTVSTGSAQDTTLSTTMEATQHTPQQVLTTSDTVMQVVSDTTPPAPPTVPSEPLVTSSMAWIPSLSVQQLVDCDTSFNRGCSGGSPLFAFHYIADHGLVPWSRYEYEEKVDVCGAELSATSQAPVAKYFIRDFGKLIMLDPTALMGALNKGPVAVGVCGTDPYFMLYSSGVFDLDTCCIDQNHAITIVGYGHDSTSGLDYWLAQNSWGTRWGENGFIKIKRADAFGDSGICGMLINPMFASGGYILDEKGNYIDPTRTAHYPIYVTNYEHWIEDNWREAMLVSSAVLMAASVLVLIYACYLERLMYLASQGRALQSGYTTINDDTNS